jgi:hypothetical protein
MNSGIAFAGIFATILYSSLGGAADNKAVLKTPQND